MQQAGSARKTGIALGIVVALVVAAGAGCGTAGRAASRATSSRPGTLHHRPAPGPATFPSPVGVKAAWVIDENRRPGTTAWRITGTPPGFVDGFADHISAVAGDTVTLFVSTDAPSYRADAYRMGYYGGAGARLVWSSKPIPGREQPPCPVTPGVHMVACDNWAPSLHVAIGAAFVPGDYLFKLTGSGGQASYVPLTVRAPASHAAYVVKNDVFTWQAWNPYGGYDYYAGIGSCPPGVYPICTRARVVSYDRPYGYGGGAGDFLGSEYPLIQLVEKEGLDVTYLTDVDLDMDPGILGGHRALLSLGHDECWSYAERLHADSAHAQGLNVAFFAASPVLRHVRPQASPLGPDRELVDYRDSTEDPLNGHGNPEEVTGNTWSAPPASWSEVPFVGEAYAGYLLPGATEEPFVVADGNAWIFAGTGLHTGSQVPGVLWTDFDQFDPASHPANVEIFGHSPVVKADAETGRAQPYADMTYWTDPASGAGVFDSGVNSWIPALNECVPSTPTCAAPVVTRITLNLLAVFGKGPAGMLEPSRPNWQALYP